MKHRLAMVGFGGMAGWHYDLIQRIDDLEVAGIWDIKEERRTYAEGKGIHVYKSEEDLMADPKAYPYPGSGTACSVPVPSAF